MCQTVSPALYVLLKGGGGGGGGAYHGRKYVYDISHVLILSARRLGKTPRKALRNPLHFSLGLHCLLTGRHQTTREQKCPGGSPFVSEVE